MVAHQFPTAGIVLPVKKQEVISKIMDENERRATHFDIDDIAWLEQSDKPLGVATRLGI